MKPYIEDIEEQIESGTPLLEQEPEAGKTNEPATTNEPTDTTNADTPDNPSDNVFGNENEPQIDLSLTDIGKTYVLRKIYSTLNQLIKYVMDVQAAVDDKNLVKILSDLQTAKDLFVLLANNIEKYLDRLDSIIDYYRQFIVQVTKNIDSIIEKHKISDKNKK